MTEVATDLHQDLEIIDLDLLINSDIDQLHSSILDFMYHSAVFRLTEQGHSSACATKVFFSSEDNDFNDYAFSWSGFIEERYKSSFNDENVTTDNASMGIAILLVLKLTTFQQFERSAADGGGFDFYLLESDSFFENTEDTVKCRLEVSGIRKENKGNTFKNRIKIKTNQTKKSDSSRLDSYISITEFSNPKTSLIYRDYNS